MTGNSLPSNSTGHLAHKQTLEHLKQRCLKNGLRWTESRRMVLSTMVANESHITVVDLHKRLWKQGYRISIATIYRVLSQFESADIVWQHNFRGGRSYYEIVSVKPHDHLIDVDSGTVIEFHNPDLDALKATIAREYGYELVDCRVELYVQAPPEKS